MPFAEQMLTTYGEFYPYAVSMGSSGEITVVESYDGREHPPSQAIIDVLQAGLQTDARAGKVKATALVYDIRIDDRRTGKNSDAINIALDHRDNYSVVVLFPYSMVEGKLNVGAPFAQAGEHSVFPMQA